MHHKVQWTSPLTYLRTALKLIHEQKECTIPFHQAWNHKIQEKKTTALLPANSEEKEVADKKKGKAVGVKSRFWWRKGL